MPTQRVRIRIDDPILEAKKTIEAIKEEFGKISESFKFYNSIVVAVFMLGFLILIFTLATILFQSWQFNSTYQNEGAQLKIQESVIQNDIQIQQQFVNTLNSLKK